MRRVIATLLWVCAAAHGQTIEPAPFVDAKYVRERFDSLTPQDLEEIRGLRILVASKSLGLNLNGGLGALARTDKAFALRRERFDVEGKGLNSVPADFFKEPGMATILGTRYPLHKRVEEVDELLRRPPWSFGRQVDAVMIVYSAIKPETFTPYAAILDRLRSDFPNICFIYATAALNAKGVGRDGANEQMHAFSELLRRNYRGKTPIYDLGAIVSDDFREGRFMVPEFTKDPTGVHPNLPAGEAAMAKGFLLVLRDGVRWQRKNGAAAAQIKGAAVPAAPTEERLAAAHPDYRAVRAILDHNGLRAVKVEGVTQVRGGRVVALHIQEMGIAELPEAIGALTALEILEVYGDRALGKPLLRKISPAIGRCTALRQLTMNNNDLETLPVEIAGLVGIESLSLADNRLKNLPKPVEDWAQKRDPDGLKRQAAP